MKVFGNRVLVEQKVEVKVSNILLPGGKKAENQTSVQFKVLAVGAKVEEIQEGDIPIFGKHVQFHGVKVIEKTEDKEKGTTSEILHVIVYDEDILGADDPNAEPVIINEETVKKVK
jgi:hypothetical protein